MANVMVVMNLLMVLDISDESKKRLCDMYVQVQGSMMTPFGGGLDIANYWRELLDIVQRELEEAGAEANANPAMQLESAQRQITSKIAGHSNSIQKA